MSTTESFSEAVSLARLMGLPRAAQMSDFALVQRVERGLPLTAATRVAGLIDPDDPSLIDQIVPRSTRARRKSRKMPLSRDESEKVIALARVLNEGLKMWSGDEEAATRFFNRPHPLLHGRTPLDVATESTTGADLVVNLMAEARAGVAI